MADLPRLSAGPEAHEAGSCEHQPPGVRHRELGRSDDVEMLEIVLPADFTTEEVASVDGERVTWNAGSA